jgi:DNA-binding response OmpR family regulator
MMTQGNTLVLIVDDDAAIREMLQTTLKIKGYQVIVAEDGQEALHLLEAFTPQVILLDLMMPRMDGYAFLEEVERRGLRSHFAILVLTAQNQRTSELARWSVDGFITKPFHLAHLMQMIDEVINRRTDTS